jgi:hypothetical protein
VLLLRLLLEELTGCQAFAVEKGERRCRNLSARQDTLVKYMGQSTSVCMNLSAPNRESGGRRHFEASNGFQATSIFVRDIRSSPHQRRLRCTPTTCWAGLSNPALTPDSEQSCWRVTEHQRGATGKQSRAQFKAGPVLYELSRDIAVLGGSARQCVNSFAQILAVPRDVSASACVGERVARMRMAAACRYCDDWEVFLH